MSFTFNQTYECSNCGYVFEGLSGSQYYGDDIYDCHNINPMICKKCNNMKNVVTDIDIEEDDSICEKCGIEMDYMEEDVIYECPKCHKKTLKCVNTDDVYSTGTIYLY